MRKYYRVVVFSDAYLMDAFRYKDQFQLVPIYYASNAPLSKYAKHCPCFLEYVADEMEEYNPTEENLKKLGIDDKVLHFARTIPNQIRVQKEILLLLNSLTNFHFFVYDSNIGSWGIQTPLKNIEDMSDEEKLQMNSQVSHWTLPGYFYSNSANDLKISGFTSCKSYCEPTDNGQRYFTHNPNIENNPEIKFPPHLEFCINRYYQLPFEMRCRVRQCMGLLKDGVDLFNNKRSAAILSIVSSIEGMALLDFELYGKIKKLGPSSRFKRYLRLYVAGLSEEKYAQYYARRSYIAHEGYQFLSDVDLYGDIFVQESDCFLRLEILQCARLALYNWLRRKE